MATVTYRSLGPVPEDASFGRKYVWQLPVRVSHWVNVLAITTLFWTGLYMASPILSSNGEAYRHFVMGRIREIHFIAGYTLLFSFLLRVYWFYVGNNYARSGFPFVWRKAWWADLKEQGIQYLRLHRGNVHLGHNALAGAGLYLLRDLPGMVPDSYRASRSTPKTTRGDSGTRWWAGSSPCWAALSRLTCGTTRWPGALWSFCILHIYIVLFDSHQFRNGLITSIVSGYKFYEKGDLDHDRWLN